MTERILKLGTGTILNVQKKLAMINEAKPGLSEQLARPAGGGGISSGSFQAGGGRHYVRVRMVEGQGEREVVCRGMVMLHTSDTLWVDRCQEMVRQPTLGTHSRLSPGWLERGLPPTTGTSWSCCTKWLTRLAFPDKTWRSSYGGHRAVSGAAQGGGHSPGG